MEMSSEKKQPINRSGTRVPCNIPISVRGIDLADQISTRGMIILANLQGCAVKCFQPIPIGTTVQNDGLPTQSLIIARVVNCIDISFEIQPPSSCGQTRSCGTGGRSKRTRDSREFLVMDRSQESTIVGRRRPSTGRAFASQRAPQRDQGSARLAPLHTPSTQLLDHDCPGSRRSADWPAPRFHGRRIAASGRTLLDHVR